MYLSYENIDNIKNLFVVEKFFTNSSDAESYLIQNSVNPEIYRCDPRYFFAIKSEKELIIEQANIERYFNNFIKSESINIIFSGFATYGIWTIPHEIARSMGISSYRMLDFHHLNLDLSKSRTWFTNDIYMETWEKEEYRFNWNSKNVESFIDNYIKGIKENNIVLTQTALPHQGLFYANSFSLVFKNVIRMFIRNDNKSIHRIKSVFNYFFTKKKQSDISDLNSNFLIFPLNAAYDEQLLLRGSYIKDIYSSIQIICNSLPLGMKLIIRQHPVDPGGLSYYKIRKLLLKNADLHIVDHNIPLNQLIAKSSGMITVNSTSAFDSLINEKPVFVLGRTFYSNTDAVTTVKDIRNLTQELNSFIKKGFKIEQFNAFVNILKNICFESYPEPNNNENISYHEHLGLAIKSKLELMEK